jgi:hypothetical protein
MFDLLLRLNRREAERRVDIRVVIANSPGLGSVPGALGRLR